MTQIITKAGDELLFKLIELTDCDAVEWYEEAWYYGCSISNLKVRCKLGCYFLIRCYFDFEGWKRKAWVWNQNDPIILLCDAVMKQQHRRKVEDHKRQVSWRLQKKKEVMALKCKEDS
jgi:hypothetical protein